MIALGEKGPSDRITETRTAEPLLWYPITLFSERSTTPTILQELHFHTLLVYEDSEDKHSRCAEIL